MGRRRTYNESTNTCCSSASIRKRRSWLPTTTTRVWATSALFLLNAHALLVPTTVVITGGCTQGLSWGGLQETRRGRTSTPRVPGRASSGSRYFGGGISSLRGHESSSWVGRGSRWQRQKERQRRIGTGARGSARGASVYQDWWRGGPSGFMMSVWDHQTPEDWEFEEEVQRLERKLDKAVSQEKYELAAKMRDKLFRLHIDESAAVLAINSAFYEAYSAADAGRMSNLWLPSDDVTCVQPWDAQFVGHEAVTRSWASLFEDLQDGAGVISPTKLSINVHGTVALIRCVEQVGKGKAGRSQIASRMKGAFSKGQKGSEGGSKGAGAVRKVKASKSKGNPVRFVATNIFRKAGGRCVTAQVDDEGRTIDTAIHIVRPPIFWNNFT